MEWSFPQDGQQLLVDIDALIKRELKPVTLPTAAIVRRQVAA